MKRRQMVLLEYVLLFLLLPVLYWQGWLAIPFLLVLLPAALLAAGWLRARWPSERRGLWSGPDRLSERLQLRRLLWRFGMVLGAVMGLLYAFAPDRVPALPSGVSLAWLGLLILYATLSVYPQEVLCRAYFFARYRRLFPGRSMMLASALSFAAIHMVYSNAVAVALSLIGGWFFADTYARTASLRLVWLEHSLYGTVVFTIGFGPYFHHPTLSF